MSNDKLIAELDALIAANAERQKTGDWQDWEVEIMTKYRSLSSMVLAVKLDRSLCSIESKKRRLAVDWARQAKKI